MKRENPAFGRYLLFAPECSEQALNQSNYPAGYLKNKSVYIIAGHMDVIASRMQEMIKLLYTGYWSSDYMNESDFSKDMSLPDIYSMTDKENRTNFGQSNLLSASNIICYLGGAMLEKDTLDVHYFTDLFRHRLDSVRYVHPNALSSYADLMAKNKEYALAERFMIRALKEYDRLGLDHQTWYPRQTFALNILAPMNKPSQAWEVLDHCKNIFVEDREEFSYYQALLAERSNYRVVDAISLLRNALPASQVLSENFMSAEEAKTLLERLRKM